MDAGAQMNDEMKMEQKSWSNPCHDKRSEDNSKLQLPQPFLLQ